jgi:tetratricopeptide (TPR) repeat protein
MLFALNDLGYYMVERNENLTEALKLIQRAVDAEPNNGWYLDSLGWAHYKLNHLEEAEKYLAQAATSAKSATIFEHLGDLYDRTGKKEAAQQEWQRALSMPAPPDQTARLRSKLGIETQK